MALEDAATLAEFLAVLPTKEQLPAMMSAYSAMRRHRLESIRRLAYGNQRFFTMPDGPEQKERDRKWAAMTAGWRGQVEAAGGMEAFGRKLAEKAEKDGRVKADPEAEDFRTPEARMYVHGYDVFTEAKSAAATTVKGLA